MFSIIRQRVMISFITIMILTMMLSSISMANADVLATGKRTIKQKEDTIATDLHFVVYQADRESSHILGWVIELSVSFTKIKAVPSAWPFDDGKTHSITIDIEGINVPKNKKVDITATLILNSYNTVKFKDIEWSYPCGEDNEKGMPADIGWAIWPVAGSSNGGWVIAKFTTKDQSGNVLAVDLVGHEYKSTEGPPDLYDMYISNGTPDYNGNTTVYIADWCIADLPAQTLPPWDDIENWSNWDISAGGSISLPPGCSKDISGRTAPPIPTDPPPTPSPTPTPLPTSAP